MNRRALLAGAAALVATRARAEDDLLARMARARAGLRTLAGPFTQERAIGLLATKVRSTGRFALAMPDRLRWELAAPDDVVYWLGPEGIAYRSKSGGGRLPAGAAGATAAVADLRGFLAGDLATLRARYDLRVVDPRETGGAPVIEATPRVVPEAPKVKRVRLTLDPDLARPREVILGFGPREETRIVFGELVRDAPVDPALLRAP